MHDDRCPNCDRVIAAADNADEGMCEVELSFNSRRRTSDWNRSARRACDDHAVDWRARALAAEAALVELTERAASSGAPTPDVEAAIADLCHEIRSQSCDEDSGRATASGDAEEHRARRDLRAAIGQAVVDGEVRGWARAERELSDLRARLIEFEIGRPPPVVVVVREVTANVDAAIASLIAAARDATNYEPDRTTVAKHLAAERSVKEETAKLRAAIAAEIKRKMVSVAPALPPIDDDAQELIDGLVAANRPAPGKRTAIATAAPATVGDFVIEYADPIAPSVWIGPEKPTHKIRQLRAGRVRSWSRGGGWDAWGTAMMRVDFDLPARLITDAAEAEADPASRWPIVAAAPPEDPAR